MSQDSTTSSLLEFIENSQISTKFSAIKEDPNQFLSAEERGKLIENVIKDSADEVIRDDIDEAIDLGADVDHDFDENLFQNGAGDAAGQNGEDHSIVSLKEALMEDPNTEIFNEFETSENQVEVDVLVHDDEVMETLEKSEAENEVNEIEIEDHLHVIVQENGVLNDESETNTQNNFPIPKPRASQGGHVVSSDKTEIESEGIVIEIENENKMESHEAEDKNGESDDEITENDDTFKEIVEKVDQGTGENNHIDPLFGVASPAANETIGKKYALK